MTQILIQNGLIITMNETRDVYTKGDILIESNQIKLIGQIDESKLSLNCERYDAKNKIIMPGLINTHVHTSQQLARGLADDVPLLTWLKERIWPYESSFDFNDSYISTLACCIELIKSGVTTFLEAGGQYVDAMVEAVKLIGIRGCLSASIMDCGEGLPEKWIRTTDDCLSLQEELYKKYNASNENRIKIWFGLRTIFNNSDSLIKRTKDLADKYNTGIHMHVAEIEEEIQFVKNKTENKSIGTIDHLNNLQVLGSNLLAVHSVWLTDNEINLIKEKNVKVCHCPAAAMKVVLGFSKVAQMLEKKISVSIGTDGAPSNNKMDIFRDMFLTAIIHKGKSLNPEILKAEEILEMVTINAAKCSLMENEIGSLEVGKNADLIILNGDLIESLPIYDVVSSIVYSMSSQNVESSLCNGKWIMKNRKILTVNEEKIIEEVKNCSKKFESILKNKKNKMDKFNYI